MSTGGSDRKCNLYALSVTQDGNMSPNRSQKKETGSPRAALILNSVFAGIFIFIFISSVSVNDAFARFILSLVWFFSPIVGTGLAISSLARGKKRIGTEGVAISIIAIALPILTILHYIIQVETGNVVVGM